MSVFTPNNAGTVRFNSGSKTINGTGTLFKGYRAGSTISIPGVGSMQLAEDPASDTTATGLINWDGATTTFKAFEYHPRNEEGVFSDTFVSLLNKLRNGMIQSLIGVDGTGGDKLIKLTGPGAAEAVTAKLLLALNGLDGTGGDKMIKLTGPGTAQAFAAKNLIAEAAIDGTDGNWLSYFTGAGTKARTALTAKARTLLGKLNNADILAEIGAQPAGNYQAANAGLSAIAALPTQPFGRSLLTALSGPVVFEQMGASQSVGQHGSFRFPNGIHIQWGEGLGPGWKAFPSAFGNACFGIFGSVVGYEELTDRAVVFSSSQWNLTHFHATPRYIAPGVVVNATGEVFEYLAIGYTA